MSPTLYTAKNNGKKNNGGNMTIRISMTMANNGIGMERLQSAFPGFCCRIVSETYGNIGAEKQMKLIRKRQFTDNVVGHTRHCIDRMYLELWGGDILSERLANRSVPLHPPPFKGVTSQHC